MPGTEFNAGGVIQRDGLSGGLQLVPPTETGREIHMADKLPGQMLTGFAVRRVGMIGLGQMGHAFAVNLVEDGHQVFGPRPEADRGGTGSSRCRATCRPCSMRCGADFPSR